MELIEAKTVVEKLGLYKGRTMLPYKAPVKGFLILPAEQEAFDQMFKDMTENGIPYDSAIEQFAQDVTVIVYFGSSIGIREQAQCNFESFLDANEIKVA